MLNDPSRHLLRRTDLSRLLRVSVRTVDALATCGTLRPIRLGRSVRFLQADIDALLQAASTKEAKRGK
ncbi:MAG: helix-turn-helix transcriptional regulator [Phycisphaerales bacterium]